MISRIGIVILAATAWMVSACERPKPVIPEGVLSMKQMVPLLVDVHIAQAAVNVFPVVDTTRYTMNDYLAHILAAHNVEKAVYDSSIAYYTLHPEMMQAIYEDVINELSRKQGEASAK